MKNYDVIIIGAGAAGLFCAGLLSKKKIKCLLLEKNNSPGKKIIISGGGRCNFTNLKIEKKDFNGESNNFHWSILKNYTNDQFIELIKSRHIPFYEKKLGQLFCKNSSKDVLNLLIKEINHHYVEILYDNEVTNIEYRQDEQSKDDRYIITHGREFSHSNHCIIASGGLPMPAIGGSDFGLKMAKKFHLNIVPPQEALVPIVSAPYSEISGISIPSEIKISKQIVITDDLLFTHKGLSGPIILKATLYKSIGESFFINLLPSEEIQEILKISSNQNIHNILAKYLPSRLVKFIIGQTKIRDIKPQELSKKEINSLADYIHRHEVQYSKNEGYRKAEVMKGGVATKDLKKSMETREIKNLYFIGETVDVTGLLGGFNFQWAWSSAYACAQDIIKKHENY